MFEVSHFEKVGDLKSYFEREFTVNISIWDDVISYFKQNEINIAYFGYLNPNNLYFRDFQQAHQTYDSVICYSARVKRAYWLFLKTDLIWTVRFHFQDDVLVEIVAFQTEVSPL